MKSAHLFTIILLAGLFSCQLQKRETTTSYEQIYGLATPVKLNPDKTDIVLADYFTNPNLIDSASIPRYFAGNFSENKTTYTIINNHEEFPFISTISFWIDGQPYSLLLKKSKKIKYTLDFDPQGKKYKEVKLTGEMNGWNPKESDLTFANGNWSISLNLTPGKYQYQLVLDGKWVLDPGNPIKVENNIGGVNSLMQVGKDVSNKIPHISTLAYEDWNIALVVENRITDVVAFWQNNELPSDRLIINDKTISIGIPQEAKHYNRSWIRIWTANEFGESNDILIPLSYGKVVSSASQLNRSDWEASVFYFLMVDRFNNGQPGNDELVDDPEILPPANYYGGDLSGVINKIKDGYFNDLGINTIWLSPIAQNPLGAYGLWPEPRSKFSGYHGYWPISSSKIDHRFGTSAELEELIGLAHKNNLNMILDYVANHVHKLHPVYQQHPDWATDLYLPDSSLNTERWDEYRLTTWFDVFLPTLDLENPMVSEVMSDSGLYWLQHYEFDGFRHDATKHIPEIFWRKLTKKVKDSVAIPQHKRVYQVGETYGNRELIGSYVSSGMMDAQFDFNVYDQTVSTFARKDESFKNLSASLQESLNHYGYHNLMGYISGNQDKPRFISLAGGDLRFDEDAKLAGWTRNIGVGDEKAYHKLQSMMAFNLTIPGIPTIYYGDEFGMPGANDPDNRRMMRFDELSQKEKETREIITQLVKLRRSNIQFTYGDFEWLLVEDNTMVYARTYFDKIGFVVFNKQDEPVSVSFKIPERFNDARFKSNFGSDLSVEEGFIELIVDAGSFEVIMN
ncbi:MAG: alpha-amylase family glycosyl hydrolase [Bacteroidales bacterium]